MSDLRIGLVGCGLWGKNILRDLQLLNAEVIVADPSPDVAALVHASGAAHCAAIGDLPQVDGLIVATPAATHVDVVEECLAFDVPVFVEKPFTLDYRSAQALAARAPDRLFVMHVWRYHPGVEAIRDLVRDEAFGPVEWVKSVRANWTSPRTDVDSVWTMLPHDVSMVFDIFGTLPDPISAVAEWHADASGVRRPTGIVTVLGTQPAMVLETSTRYGDKRREFRVHCRDAVLVLTGTDSEYVTVHRGNNQQPTDAVVERIPISHRSALLRELEAFLDHLSGGPSPKSGIQDALQITRTVVNIRKMAGLDD